MVAKCFDGAEDRGDLQKDEFRIVFDTPGSLWQPGLSLSSKFPIGMVILCPE